MEVLANNCYIVFREQWKAKPYQALLVSACNASIWEAKAGDQEYKLILSCTVQSQAIKPNQTIPTLRLSNVYPTPDPKAPCLSANLLSPPHLPSPSRQVTSLS